MLSFSTTPRNILETRRSRLRGIPDTFPHGQLLHLRRPEPPDPSRRLSIRQTQISSDLLSPDHSLVSPLDHPLPCYIDHRRLPGSVSDADKGDQEEHSERRHGQKRGSGWTLLHDRLLMRRTRRPVRGTIVAVLFVCDQTKGEPSCCCTPT